MTRSDEHSAHLRLATTAARYRERARRGLSQDVLPLWECDRRHAWDGSLETALNIHCMNCATQRREHVTKRLRDLAKERGGALLSTGFVDHATPLRWQCAYGHVWRARADLAPRLWCVECARTVFSRYR
jgi:hypothetical protein